jgi:hypothetical protein
MTEPLTYRGVPYLITKVGRLWNARITYGSEHEYEELRLRGTKGQLVADVESAIDDYLDYVDVGILHWDAHIRAAMVDLASRAREVAELCNSKGYEARAITTADVLHELPDWVGEEAGLQELST